MSRRFSWTAAACAALLTVGDAFAARPTIFVVSAHPDDFEGCVGTMFLLRHKYDIHMMDYTAGEAGLGKAGFDSGEAKRLRYKEECDACGYVGAKLYYSGEKNAPGCYPEQQAYANRATCEKIAALIRELKPRAVFTHWPVDHHDDHTMTAMAVMKAIEMSGLDPEVFYFEQGPWEVAQFMPHHYVDISNVVKQRETFTRFYRCQGPDELVGEKLALSTWRGQRDLWPRVPHVELLAVRTPRPVGTPSVLDDIPKAMPPVTFIAYPDRRLRVYAGGAAFDFTVAPPPEKSLRRIDAVVKDRDGTVRLVPGVPDAVAPKAPVSAPGETFLGTVRVASDVPWGDGALFPN